MSQLYFHHHEAEHSIIILVFVVSILVQSGSRCSDVNEEWFDHLFLSSTILRWEVWISRWSIVSSASSRSFSIHLWRWKSSRDSSQTCGSFRFQRWSSRARSISSSSVVANPRDSQEEEEEIHQSLCLSSFILGSWATPSEILESLYSSRCSSSFCHPRWTLSNTSPRRTIVDRYVEVSNFFRSSSCFSSRQSSSSHLISWREKSLFFSSMSSPEWTMSSIDEQSISIHLSLQDEFHGRELFPRRSNLSSRLLCNWITLSSQPSIFIALLSLSFESLRSSMFDRTWSLSLLTLSKQWIVFS